MRLRGETFKKRRCRSGFADASLAGEQNHLTFATLCLRPALNEHFEFVLSPHKLCQTTGVKSLEAAFN